MFSKIRFILIFNWPTNQFGQFFETTLCVQVYLSGCTKWIKWTLTLTLISMCIPKIYRALIFFFLFPRVSPPSLGVPKVGINTIRSPAFVYFTVNRIPHKHSIQTFQTVYVSCFYDPHLRILHKFIST